MVKITIMYCAKGHVASANLEAMPAKRVAIVTIEVEKRGECAAPRSIFYPQASWLA